MNWPKWIAICAIISLGSWLLHTLVEHGKVTKELSQYKASYASLEEEASKAIAKLEKEAGRLKDAANERETATVKRLTEANAHLTALQGELNDARNNGDQCLDIPLPQPRADRVRELANSADQL
jgi:polyhydroxyalkanoate synthesis regulator phasin